MTQRRTISCTMMAAAFIATTGPVLAGKWISAPDSSQASTSSTSGTPAKKPSPTAPSVRATTPVVRQTQSTTNSTTNTDQRSDPQLKRFLAAVRANFNIWDRNHDGTLDRQEMEISAQDFRFKGDAAITLAVLKKSADTIFRDKNELSLLRLADMDAIETKASVGLKLDPDYARDFETISSKLKSEPKQLFTAVLPHLFAIQQANTQANLMDCYFLSSVSGLVETNPKAIVEMIRLNSDGTYSVAFPGNNKPLIIPPPTETEMACYTDSVDGFWLYILEKACGRSHNTDAKRVTAESLDSAALYKDRSAEVMKLISGREVKTINLQEAKGPNKNALTSTVRAALTEVCNKHQIVTASKADHAYTITAYDTSKDMITLHNLYGLTGWEYWIDGKRGPRMEHGYFECSMTDFIKNFRQLNYVL